MARKFIQYRTLLEISSVLTPHLYVPQVSCPLQNSGKDSLLGIFLFCITLSLELFLLLCFIYPQLKFNALLRSFRNQKPDWLRVGRKFILYRTLLENSFDPHISFIRTLSFLPSGVFFGNFSNSRVQFLSVSLFLPCFMFYAPVSNIRICEYTPRHPLDEVTFGNSLI